MTTDRNEGAKRRGKLRFLAIGIVLVTPFLMARPAAAFECSKYIVSAQTAVDELHDLMKTMKGKMRARDIRFVHSILDDARMFIGGAIHNHEEALGYRDHVNAIIRAHQARGQVIAATKLHDAFMRNLEKTSLQRSERG